MEPPPLLTGAGGWVALPLPVLALLLLLLLLLLELAAFTMTWAEPLLEGSATETAVTVTVIGAESEVGAMYRPEPETVPVAGPPPAAPSTSQVTPVCEVLLTVAVNAWLAPAARVTEGGVTVTVIGAESTVS